ncbi:hypothetical protein FIB48_03380 [Lactococcus lactis subsp. lactis]|nr:hypothetical protein FIB48_03380 [Lactococcus lactis subsp. lactis]
MGKPLRKFTAKEAQYAVNNLPA